MEFVKKKLRKPDLSEKKTFHIKCVNHNKMKYMRQNITLFTKKFTHGWKNSHEPDSWL